MAVADPVRRSNCPPPVAGGLAPGVGSGTPQPRGNTRNLEEARLAAQTRLDQAKPWSFRRCPVAPTTQAGGRLFPGPSLRRANVEQASRLYIVSAHHAVARHWRERSDFQPRQWSALAASAVQGTRQACNGMGKAADVRGRKSARCGVRIPGVA